MNLLDEDKRPLDDELDDMIKDMNPSPEGVIVYE